MKKRLKGFYLIASSCIIAVLHLPFAFAKSASANGKLLPSPAPTPVAKKPNGYLPVINTVKNVYDSLHLNLAGLSQQAFEYAKKGFNKLVEEGKFINDSIISIVDFSQPSSKKRLYILDMKNYKVLFNTFVAHGKNTGLESAVNFSNKNSSLMSSPGFYATSTTYEGKNGYSLRLVGLERGINDNALERGIVVHGAPYVSQAMVNVRGFVGRSWGCPAVPETESRPIINTIKNGTCMFIYHPSYVRQSNILNDQG